MAIVLFCVWRSLVLQPHRQLVRISSHEQPSFARVCRSCGMTLWCLLSLQLGLRALFCVCRWSHGTKTFTDSAFFMEYIKVSCSTEFTYCRYWSLFNAGRMYRAPPHHVSSRYVCYSPLTTPSSSKRLTRPWRALSSRNMMIISTQL
jgi:hypothetical protein